jgi:hypothetical protein
MKHNICIERLSGNATKMQVVKSFILGHLYNDHFSLWQSGIQGDLPSTAAGNPPLPPLQSGVTSGTRSALITIQICFILRNFIKLIE